MHTLLIDFKQAFNSVDRKVITQVFSVLGIPSNLTRLTCTTLINITANIVIQQKETDAFHKKSGVKKESHF